MNMQSSVHLQNFPKVNFKVDNEIVRKMDEIREICNCVFSLRKDANIRVRMPLKSITICGNSNLDNDCLDLIKQEVNVKNIEIFEDNLDKIAKKEVVLNMKECGRLFGSKLKNILSEQKAGNWQITNNKLQIAGLELEKELFDIIYKSKDGKKTIACQNFNLLVMINTEQTRDLIIEGLSRDLIRIIQQTRKDNGLEISDKINVILNTKDPIFEEILSIWKDYIMEQTLSKNMEIKNETSNEEIIKEYFK